MNSILKKLTMYQISSGENGWGEDWREMVGEEFLNYLGECFSNKKRFSLKEFEKIIDKETGMSEEDKILFLKNHKWNNDLLEYVKMKL